MEGDAGVGRQWGTGGMQLYAGKPPPWAVPHTPHPHPGEPPPGRARGLWPPAAALAVPAKWLEKDLDCTVKGRILPEAKLS